MPTRRPRSRSSLKHPAFPLLSDYPDGATAVAYGVDHHEGEAGRLYARPSFFLIEKDGVIRGYWGQRPPNADEVVAPDPLVSERSDAATGAVALRRVSDRRRGFEI